VTEELPQEPLPRQRTEPASRSRVSAALGNPRSLGKRTGLKTESVYRRYAILSEADLSDGVAKLAALHAKPDQQQRPHGRGRENGKAG
jgi:hypothetical protein